MIKKLLLIMELATGLLLLLCVIFNGKDSPLSVIIGMDLNIKNGAVVAGIFYFIKEIVNFVLSHAEPTSGSFLHSFLMILEILAGACLAITGYCDGRDTIIEKTLDMSLSVHYGIGALGVLYISKTLSDLMLSVDASVE